MNALRKHIRFLHGMNEAVEIAKLPLEQQSSLFGEWRRKWGTIDKVGDGMTLAGMSIEDSFLTTHAILRCALAALAAERYRRQTGDWPRSLADLVPNYLSAVPLDPFDATQLRYRRTAEGAVIYSVGRDGRDDGGNTEPLPDDHFPRDVVFTLWNLDRRRRLPRLP